MQAPVEKQGGDVGAVEHILQIVRRRSLPVQGLVQLPVEAGQLLVQNLKFFLGGRQSRAGRLMFFVDGRLLLANRILPNGGIPAGRTFGVNSGFKPVSTINCISIRRLTFEIYFGMILDFGSISAAKFSKIGMAAPPMARA